MKANRIALLSSIGFITFIATFATIAFFGHRVLYGGACSYTNRWGWNDLEHEESGTISYYPKAYATKKDAWDASKALALDIQEEGTTLLKNDGALPFTPSEKAISVFGVSSVDMIYGGTGSGEGEAQNNIDLFSALSGEGFQINPALKDFYVKKHKEGYRRGLGTDMNGNYYGTRGQRDYGYSINEVEIECYVDVENSYSSYSDAAIIVISRSGGEGQDLPTSMLEFHEGDERHYLQLTEEEEQLIRYVGNKDFGKTVVLLNTMNPFECGFILDDSFGVDAALHIGAGGNYGLIAVAEILSGKRMAQGRLADIYPTSLLSAPAMQNYGDNRFLDHGEITSAAYVAYSEGIYVGYRYYETRYEDYLKHQGNAGDFRCEDNVVFPFGFGLNYSSFDWSGLSYVDEGEEIVVSINVKNVGNVKDKDTLELYLQKPYTERDKELGIEKASIQLADFRKTDLLEPGEEKSYELRFDKREFSSYDTKEKKTYRMDAGDYWICLGKSSHDALNNILAHQGMSVSGDARLALTYHQSDDIVFSHGKNNVMPITNRFETETYTSIGPEQGFLTRSDWKGSFPTPYGDSGIAGKRYCEFKGGVKAAILNTDSKSHLGPNDDKTDFVLDLAGSEFRETTIGKPIVSSKQGLHFMDLIDDNGKPFPYGDSKWQKLVECLSPDELYSFVSWGSGVCDELITINKKLSVLSDAPMGFHYGGTTYPCYPIQAATFSKTIPTRLGEQMAAEASFMNIRAWWSPTCNTHRHPFGGRSYEYYSEDDCLIGKYAANVVKAAQSRGLCCLVKHFALNDQDTNRGDRGNFRNDDPYNGLITYANEQTIREIYLKGFQYAVEEGGAHGVMTSYNRIGHTWAGGHYGLLTNVLKGEWGMRGMALTDYAGTFGYRYMNMKQGLRAGNDMWLHPSKAFPIDEHTSDAAIYYLQKAAKNILYMEACSSRVNGMRYIAGEEVTVKPVVYVWKVALISIESVTLLSSGAGVFLILRADRKSKKQKTELNEGSRANKND